MNAYLVLAAGYRQLKQLDVGTLVCKNALALFKKQPQILNMFGLIHLDRDDVKNAVHSFGDAVAAKPDFVDAMMNLGAASLEYKDFSTAITEFEKVVRLQPSNIMAMLSLGTAYRGANRPKDALKTYTKLIQAHPDNNDVHFNLCVLYQESIADYANAAKECKTFLDRTGPKHPMYTDVSKRYKGILETIDALKESKELSAPKTIKEGPNTSATKKPQKAPKTKVDKKVDKKKQTTKPDKPMKGKK